MLSGGSVRNLCTRRLEDQTTGASRWTLRGCPSSPPGQCKSPQARIQQPYVQPSQAPNSLVRVQSSGSCRVMEMKNRVLIKDKCPMGREWHHQRNCTNFICWSTLDLSELLHTASVNLLKTSPSQEWASDIYRWKLGKQTRKQSTRRPILSEAEFVNLPLVESHSSFSAGALSPTLPPSYFLLPFFKTFVTHPPKINELDTVVTSTPVLRPWQPPKLWNVHQCSISLLTKWSLLPATCLDNP